MLQNSKGNVTPFNESDIPKGITFLGVSTVRQKLRLTVLYLSRRMQNSQSEITPLIKAIFLQVLLFWVLA